VVPNLCQYATMLANSLLNITPRTQDGTVPVTLLAVTDCPPRLDHIHPFGCPAFELDSNLQQGKKIGKYENRSCTRKYLVPSATHARSVHLIPSTISGEVWQFLWNNKMEIIFTEIRMALQGQTNKTKESVTRQSWILLQSPKWSCQNSQQAKSMLLIYQVKLA